MSFVYKLEIAGHYYIGSTIQSIDERMRHHKKAYKKGLERKLYNFVKENGGWELVVSSVIVECDITDRKELRKLEQTYINKKDPLCLNANKAHSTRAVITRDYREAHREARAAYNKDWGAVRITCECGAEFRRGYKPTHKKSKIHTDWLAKPSGGAGDS